jgi:hypothetical protein
MEGDFSESLRSNCYEQDDLSTILQDSTTTPPFIHRAPHTPSRHHPLTPSRLLTAYLILIAEVAPASVTVDEHGNDMRQELSCRVVEDTGGVAVDTDVTATSAREPDVGVAHGHLINKLVLVVAYKRITSMLVDCMHECRSRESSLLTEHCSQGIALGTGLSKLALESSGEGGEEAVRHLDTLVGQVRHDAGPVAPIDGS